MRGYLQLKDRGQQAYFSYLSILVLKEGDLHTLYGKPAG